MDVPTFTEPSGALLVGLESKPVVVLLLVSFDVLDQCLVLLLEPLDPKFFLSWAGFSFEQRDAAQAFSSRLVDHVRSRSEEKKVW